MAEAELKRRDLSDVLQPWRLNNDGTDPVADEVARVRLQSVIDRLIEIRDKPDAAIQKVDWDDINPVRDDYFGGEVLPDQVGADAVLTFTFTTAVNLLVVEASEVPGAVARVDPFGGIPAANSGIPCREEAPTYMPITTGTVRVFAPSNVRVAVHGYRR